MQLSIDTIMMAMFSVHRDIKYHEMLNNDESVELSEQVDHGEYVLDLTKAFNELGTVYTELQVNYPELLPINELLDKIERSTIKR